MLPAIAAACVLTVVSAAKPPPWRSWISEFGHDVFTYPDWITDQMAACVCSRDAAGSFSCKEADAPIKPTELTFCVAKQYLLQRMPSFDQHYLPPAVTVHGKNMLDDNIAFALMANNASAFSRKLPLPLRLAYVLPYSSFHEPRNNWRPLFFSKFYNVTSETTSTIAAMQALLPHVFRDWSGNPPLSGDGESVGAGSGDGSSWSISWASSTAPPITGPFDFVAYGHGSCTAWSTMMTYVLRSVGVPARQVGTPCWNSALGGINFTGSAVSNPNVSKCWHGGSKSNGSMVFGNDYLNNHNWVELWDDIKVSVCHAALETPGIF